MQEPDIKQQLHKAIDDITDEGFLQAILIILSSKTVSISGTTLSEDQIKALQEREVKYVKGQSQAKTLDEFKADMNRKYGL